jgi:hypothetical protein
VRKYSPQEKKVFSVFVPLTTSILSFFTVITEERTLGQNGHLKGRRKTQQSKIGAEQHQVISTCV